MAGLADILSGLNQGLSDPSNAGVMGFAQGLLQAGAPHMLTPVPMGQALSQGMASSQQYQSAALKNAMQRALLPMTVAKTKAITGALKNRNSYGARAFVDNLLGGQAAVSNDPSIAGPATLAKTLNQLQKLSPSERAVILSKVFNIPAQGALPVGSGQNPDGSIKPLPGALPAIAAASGAQAGGSAAATFPFQSALKRTGIVQGPQSNRVLSFAPNPGVPGTPGGPALGSLNLGLFPGAPQAPQSSPQLLAAAQAAARRRAMGMTQGMPGTAPNASPAPQAPMLPPQQGQVRAPAGAPLIAPRPAMPPPQSPGSTPVGASVVAPGLSPSEITGQQTAQKLATQQLAADVTAGQEAQQRVANLEELNAVASGLKTGPGMDAHVAVLKALESVPGAIGISGGKLSTITNAQIFNKQSLNLSLQTVSQAGQHAYDAYKSVMNAFPELSKTNMANAVVTAGLLATARYQADRGTFASKWQQQNQGMGYVPGKGTAEGAWTQNAPFMAYFMNALPPEAQKMIVAKARTNATLRIELQRGAQGWQWLNANGY